ncbi:MAG: DUF6427 family protein [Polaribacter sp.]|jgi:hypothetical protein|nr:DUF6427 family protein [Polaribacter sp.]MDG1221911.1 DUF6427 family protein [Polaribacter sp.]
MLTNFFGKSKPINFIVLLLVFFCAFFLNSFHSFSASEMKPFFMVEKTVFFLVLTFLLFGVNFIISRNKLTLDNSYALLFYLLVISFFSKYLYDYQVFLEYFLHLFFLRKVYSLQTLKEVFKKLFDAGFWLGVMCLMNPFLIVFSLLLFTAIIVHKRVRFQTLLIPVIGFLIPIFLFFTYSFWIGELSLFTDKFIFYTTYDFSRYQEASFLAPLGVLSFFLLFAIFMKTGSAFSVNNRFRKSWILLLSHLFTSISYLFITFDRDGSELLIAAFPVAVILANGFESIQRNFLKEIGLILFVLIALLGPLFL